MTRSSVAAYITAYEDTEALNACLRALQLQTYQIDRIFIVDNSRQPLPVVSNSRLRVFHHPENIGIAAGIRVAIEHAAIEGYNFLWMFDQDSQPMSNCLELLLETYAKLAANFRIGIVAPQAIDARTGETIEPAVFLVDRFKGMKAPGQTEPFECDAPITSGSLLCLKTVQQVKSPDPRLFIDGVDLDYGLRLQRAGFHHFVVPQAVMQHRFGEPIVVRFAGEKKILQLYSALRHYYICRNHTYLELTYAKPGDRINCSLSRIKYAVQSILIILLFDPSSKFQKIKACIIGTYRGLRGDLNQPWK